MPEVESRTRIFAVKSVMEKQAKSWEAPLDFDPDSMSVDQLWEIHERIGEVLCAKIQSEQRKLEGHLTRLQSGFSRRDFVAKAAAPAKASAPAPIEKVRRPYPKVKAKYANPKDPSETWAGRGKQPRWLVAELERGRSLDEFLIDKKSAGRRKKSR